MARPSRKALVAPTLLWLVNVLLVVISLAWVGVLLGTIDGHLDRLVVATSVSLASIAVMAVILRSMTVVYWAVSTSIGISCMALALVMTNAAMHGMDARAGAFALASLIAGSSAIYLARRAGNKMPPLDL
jgi:hypothetical protein